MSTSTPNALILETRGIIQRQLRLVVPVFVLCTIVVTLAAILSEPIFIARSNVFVQFGREFVYRPEVGPVERSEAYRLEEIVNTEVKILESRDLAEQVIDELTVEGIYPKILLDELDPVLAREKAIGQFQDDLSILPVIDSSVIELSYSHPDPKIAARALNFLVERFLEKHLSLFRSERPEFIVQKLEHWGAELATIDGRLQEIKSEYGVVDVAEQTRLLLGRQAELRTALQSQEAALADIAFQRSLIPEIPHGVNGSDPGPALLLDTVEVLQARRDTFAGELSTIDLRITELDHQIDAVRKQTAEGSRPLVGIEEFRSLDEAHSKLLELRIEREGLERSFRRDSRRVRTLDEEILQVERFIAERAKQVRDVLDTTAEQTLAVERGARLSMREDLLSRIAEVDRLIQRRKLQDLDEQRQSWEAQKTVTDSQLAGLGKKLRELDRIALEVSRLEREKVIAETNHQTYLKRNEEAQINEDLDRQKQISVQVLEGAHPPVEPSGLSPKLMIALGMVAGLLAGVGAAVGVEMLRGAPAPPA